jgi:hypothetical protein
MHKTNYVPDWGGLHPNMEEVQQYGFTEGMRRKGVDSRGSRKFTSTKPSIGMGDRQGTTSGGTGDFVSSDGMAYPSNVLRLGKNSDACGHSAAFPVDLPTFFIRAFSDPGDVVFDPFMGSGTTIVACEHEGRRGRGIEISPAYCDVIVERWQNLTGGKATRTK